MSELKNSTARVPSAQGPLRHLTALRRAQAQKTNAILALQRATRRCSTHLGNGATAELLGLIQADLEGARK